MRVVGIAVSEKKGERKRPVEKVLFIKNFGLKNDSHGGTIRQVSLLFKEDRDRLTNKILGPGDCAENILIEGGGIHITKGIKPGRKMTIGSAELEITEIGKELHDSKIHRYTGAPVLPVCGIFCRVIKGGEVKLGDKVVLSEKN